MLNFWASQFPWNFQGIMKVFGGYSLTRSLRSSEGCILFLSTVKSSPKRQDFCSWRTLCYGQRSKNHFSFTSVKEKLLTNAQEFIRVPIFFQKMRITWLLSQVIRIFWICASGSQPGSCPWLGAAYTHQKVSPARWVETCTAAGDVHATQGRRKVFASHSLLS